MNKLHPLPLQSVKVLGYKLESRDHYHKDTDQPSISKISQTETKIQDSQHLDGSYPSVDSHDTPLAPQCLIVNDLYARGIRERLTDAHYAY